MCLIVPPRSGPRDQHLSLGHCHRGSSGLGSSHLGLLLSHSLKPDVFASAIPGRSLLPSLLSGFSSVTQSFRTLCDSMNCSTPGLPVHHHLLEFAQTQVHRVGDAIQPSNPLSLASAFSLSHSTSNGLLTLMSSSFSLQGFFYNTATYGILLTSDLVILLPRFLRASLVPAEYCRSPQKASLRACPSQGSLTFLLASLQPGLLIPSACG